MDLNRSLALLAFATPALAGTLTVGPVGSGATYADLPDAIAAAQPGDTILVEAGQYVDATPLVVDKPLTILGAGSDVTSFEAVATRPFDQPLPLLIKDLAAGEEVRVVGLTLRSATFGGDVASTFVVRDCAGPVVLADVSAGNASFAYDTPGLGQVRDSDQVLLDGCSLNNFGTSQVGAPTPGLLVVGSQVHVNGCTLTGGTRGLLFTQGTEEDGAPGIRASGSVLRLSRTAATGGAGTSSSVFFTTAVPTRGGAGVEATASQVLVRGGSGNLLQGGEGKSGFSGGVLTHGAGGGGVEADGASLVSSVGDTQLASGPDSTGLVTTPPVDGGAVHLTLVEALATLESAAKLAPPGASAVLELGGEPGAVYLTYFSFAQGVAAAAPPIHGVILLDTQTAAQLGATTLDAAGAASLTVPVPALPSLVGASVLAQGFSAGAASASFSSATLVGIR